MNKPTAPAVRMAVIVLCGAAAGCAPAVDTKPNIQAQRNGEATMTNESEPCTALDDPAVAAVVFHPRPEAPGYAPKGIPTRTSCGDAEIGGYLHVNTNSDSLLVFFHGNGEIAADYDASLSSVYTDCGVSYWVLDYRGYGRSTGTPSFSSMFTDARAALEDIPRLEKQIGREFKHVLVMGRSLGSAPAIHLAVTCADRLTALLLDSGYAHGLELIRRLGGPALSSEDLPSFHDNINKMGHCRLPTLIVHGTNDRIIPFFEAKALYRACGAEFKRLVEIPGAGHNDLLLRGFQAYLSAVRDFLAKTTSTPAAGTEAGPPSE